VGVNIEGTAASSFAGAAYTSAGKTGTAQVFQIKQGEKYVASRIDERLRDHALYMAFAPNALEFDRECRRLLGDIHAFDVLRSDKCISSHGLEPRTPFLDRGWVAFYLSLPPSVRFQPEAMEKIRIRNAFDSVATDTVRCLPEEVLWRRKEAFSDGVTATTRSLFQILQEHAAALESTTESPPPPSEGGWCLPTTAEQRWYRRLFDSYYPDAAHVVPYFWMPKYVDAQDASARTWIV
jgi:asparagine synthase (glutamine-hydrolysing)